MIPAQRLESEGYLDGEIWRRRRSAPRLLLIIALLSAVIAASTVRMPIASAVPGLLTGVLPPAGIGLAVWGGGSPEELARSAQAQGCRVSSFWVSTSAVSDGAFIGYVFGAPAIVNEAFNRKFNDSIPPATPLVVECSHLYTDSTSQWVIFAGSDEDIRNPGRGVQESYETPIGTWTSVDPDQTTPRRYMYLPVTEDPLSPALLNGVRRDLAFARSAGLLVDLRFAYSKDFGQREPSFAAMLRHQAQLAPVVSEYAAILNTLELGLIGPWGEGHDVRASGFDENDEAMGYPKRLQLLRGWLDRTPSSVTVTMRYPHQLRWMIERGGLRASEAARTGIFNDGFLGGVDHDGTFRGSWTNLTRVDSEKAWLENFSKTHASRGESNVGVQTTPDYASIGTNWLKDGFARYHIDTLREWGLASLVLQPKGVWEEVQLRLGYRLLLKEATVPVSAAAGEKINLTFIVENDGYAAPRRPRTVSLFFGDTPVQLASIDTRTWQPGFQVVNATVAVPALPSGMYPLALAIDDPDPDLAKDPRYSIRLANTDTWDETTGRNSLNVSMQVR